MQKLEKAKRQELETETHMKVMAVQEKERLIREIKTTNKDLDEMRDRCSMYEVLCNYFTADKFVAHNIPA